MPHATAEGELTKEQIAELTKLYGRGRREIYRWKRKGIERGKPCPLWEPKKMPQWWAENMSQSVPVNILAAARGENAKPTGSQKDPPQQSSPMDITQFDMAEDEALVVARQIEAAAYHRLKEALAQGWPADHLQQQYIKASSNRSVIEQRAREDQVRRGKYISREIAERDAVTAVTIVVAMHDSMIRRWMEVCTTIPVKYRKLGADGLRRVLEPQKRAFERMNQPEAVDNFLSELQVA